MALTATTTFDIIDQTQQIIFFSSAVQVDQINFATNQITFQAISSYNLVKSDLLLYYKYINAFFLLLQVNFVISQYFNLAFPLSLFEINFYNAGTNHLQYTQTSQGNTPLMINYVPISGSASIAARASPVTISIQEFAMSVNMLSPYFNQVSLN